MVMVRNIEDILPVYKVENDCILSRQGDITIAFKLELPNIFTLSGQEYEALHHAWLKAIKVLPQHSTASSKRSCQLALCSE